MEDKVSIFMPIDVTKSVERTAEQNDTKNWYVQGWASTPDLDFQQDIVNPEGIDISYFQRRGLINYEHEKGDDYIIGEPTDNCYVDLQKGLYVEAILFKDNPHAQSMWNLAQNMYKSGSSRSLGFSIEGRVTKRNEQDPRIIEGVVIKDIALTKNPVNPMATWDMLVKSFVTGTGITPDTQQDAASLRKESLADSVRNLTYSLTMNDPIKEIQLWKSVSKELDSTGDFDKHAAVILLQLSKGISRKDAYDTLNRMEN